MKQASLTFLHNPLKALFIAAIRGYQVVISPGLPGRCKYYPSCSQYAIDAIGEYGAMRGFVLSAWRILRCNPLSFGGYDPVSRQKLFAPRCSHDHTPDVHRAGGVKASGTTVGQNGPGG
jgi:putative membrane protein insertion efficiency factor